VLGAGDDQEGERRIGKRHALTPEPRSEGGTAPPMVWVASVVHPARVMEHGEQLHHVWVGSCPCGEAEADRPHAGPVGDPMDAVPLEPILLADRLDEWGGQHRRPCHARGPVGNIGQHPGIMSC
jgi:hypothetical protein